jgi:hypothetical protein
VFQEAFPAPYPSQLAHNNLVHTALIALSIELELPGFIGLFPTYTGNLKKTETMSYLVSYPKHLAQDLAQNQFPISV